MVLSSDLQTHNQPLAKAGTWSEGGGLTTLKAALGHGCAPSYRDATHKHSSFWNPENAPAFGSSLWAMKTVIFISNCTEEFTCRFSTAEPGEACLAADLLKVWYSEGRYKFAAAPNSNCIYPLGYRSSRTTKFQFLFTSQHWTDLTLFYFSLNIVIRILLCLKILLYLYKIHEREKPCVLFKMLGFRKKIRNLSVTQTGVN